MGVVERTGRSALIFTAEGFMGQPARVMDTNWIESLRIAIERGVFFDEYDDTHIRKLIDSHEALRTQVAEARVGDDAEPEDPTSLPRKDPAPFGSSPWTAVLERVTRIEERLGLPGFTFDARRSVDLAERHVSQIESLQHAVAAIGRRANPLLTAEVQYGTASGAIAQSWQTSHNLRRVLDELSGWLQTACVETGKIDSQRGNAVNVLHELAHDCDEAAVGLNRLTEDGARNDESCRRAIRDIAVSLGDASALASMTARECT